MVRIRPYAGSETEAVVRLSLRAWAPVFTSIEQALEPAVYRTFYPDDWRVQQRRAVEAVLEHPDQNVWVAERDGVLVGFVAIVLHRDDGMGDIHMIAVDPDHQRAGIGTALTDFALSWMREVGMAVAMVETGADPGHAPARRLYEQSGFRVFPIARFFKKL